MGLEGKKGGMMPRIGLIGTGLMGRPMGQALLKAGFPLTIWNRTRDKAAALIEAGAAWAASPAAVAAASDVVITMVTDATAAETVICGPEGVLEGAAPGSSLIDMSSIPPENSLAIAGRAREKGVTMLDAPVTGNPKVAALGKLGVMVGGPRETFDRCRPIFDAMATKIVYVGEGNGLGTTLKLINNLILGVAIQASAEALVLAEKSGIDPLKVMEITSVGGARTGAMETRGPWMIERNFDAHFSVNNMYKDLSTAMKLADACGAVLPTARMSLEMLRAARAQGNGDKDSCIVLTVLEKLSGF
jgi:3-hydroxyisobutyrate dehydrogenase-like beta-hydroxyacid dehydrogenase